MKIEKKKFLKQIAFQIAKCEKIIQINSDNEAIKEKAMEKIERLSSQLTSLEDFVYVDELVLNLLEKN